MRVCQHLKIGDKMRSARERTGMSLREMARELGLASSTYSNYENYYCDPPMEVIEALCKIARISLDEFFQQNTAAAQTDYHVKTFSDFIKILVDLDRRGLPITSEVKYELPPKNQLHALLTIDFKNAQLATFIPDWNKKNQALKNGDITEEEYQRWLKEDLAIFNVKIDDYV